MSHDGDQMKMKSLMNEYFEREDKFYSKAPIFQPMILKEDVPISPREASSWRIESHPNRMVKKFEFESSQALRNFINDLLEYEEESEHNAKIQILGQAILIEVYTHYLEDITEVDQEYAATADEIYKDSNDVIDE